VILAGVMGDPLRTAADAPIGRPQRKTLGKQTVDLRVVRDDGEPVGFGVGVVREIVFKILFGVVITGGLFLLVDAL
jgi:uncharacterized RDD family membrane protein YckC